MEHQRQLPTDPAEQQVVRYLLDQLDLRERESMDERVCQDPSFFELVCALEDELILRYLRGELAGDRRARFEAIYLSNPAKRAQVEATRTLRESLREAAGRDLKQSSPPRGPVAIRFALASAAGLFLLATLLWTSWREGRSWHTPPGEVSKAPPPFAGKTVSYALEPGLLRSGGGKQITVPATAELVQLDLQTGNSLPGDAFDGVLGTPESPGIWKGPAVPEGNHLSLSVPTTALGPGDYTLRVSARGQPQGSQPVLTYYFRVVKSNTGENSPP